MGFFSKKATEKRASEPMMRNAEIIENLFDDSEKWGTKMLGQLIDYTNGTCFAEMGEEELRMVNSCIDYWKYLREMAIAWAEKSDKEYKDLVHDNEILKHQLETQRCMLRDISGDIASMKTMLELMNDQINDKSIVVKKGDSKKAE